MSGTVTSNVFRGSGVIAAAAGGLNWVSTVVTASTLTAEAGNGYWINTTSNTCTITLPASAERGDQIIFIDYARTWGTNKIILDSNGLNYQGDDDTLTVEYDTDGETLNIVYADATKGWVPLNDEAVADVPEAPLTQKGIFAFGGDGSDLNMSNLVNSSGVIGSDVSGVGTARDVGNTATPYGGDKAIFAFGTGGHTVRNLVNNSGVVASDAASSGSARGSGAGATYGADTAIVAYGNGPVTNVSNLITNSGVVSADVTGVGTAREGLVAVPYGVGLASFCFGQVGGSYLNTRNLVNYVGVVAADATGAGTGNNLQSGVKYGTTGTAVTFGGDNAGGYANHTNLISNTGVTSADVTAVSGVTARPYSAATSYGGDKGMFAFGYVGSGTYVNYKNLVSNTGVLSADSSGAGTVRQTGGAGYSYTA